MAEAPERIWARVDYDGARDGDWANADIPFAPPCHWMGRNSAEYTRSDLVQARIDEALEDAAKSVEGYTYNALWRRWSWTDAAREDTGDVASFAVNAAAAIRAMKGK